VGGTDAFDVASRHSDIGDIMTSLGASEADPAMLEDEDERTLGKRYFGKIEKGSLRGSILGMSSAAIGSGVLTFPNVFKTMGWVNGCALLLMGAFGCWWSLYMLI